jgi:threonine dehydrogenase-like Zn-dependent dehydrogenase
MYGSNEYPPGGLEQEPGKSMIDTPSPPATLLAEKIHRRQADLAVIGLGYVGLPVAAAFAAAGFRVVGLDVDDRKVSAVQRGTGAPVPQGRSPARPSAPRSRPAGSGRRPIRGP